MSNLSNSKLTKATKQTRRDYLRWLQSVGGFVFAFPRIGVTVAGRPSGETGYRIALSVTGADEKKFRRKVGEYLALDRLSAGESVYMANPSRTDPETLETWAFYIAEQAADRGYGETHDEEGRHFDTMPD